MKARLLFLGRVNLSQGMPDFCRIPAFATLASPQTLNPLDVKLSAQLLFHLALDGLGDRLHDEVAGLVFGAGQARLAAFLSQFVGNDYTIP